MRVARRISTVFAGSSGLTLEILLYGCMDRASSNSELVALVAALARVDANLARIDTRLEQLEQIERAAPALLGVAVDAFDDAANALAARDINPSERLHNLIELLDRASRRGATQRLARWLDWLEQHPALDTGLLELASDVADAFEAAQRQGASKLGPLGILRALSEASVQRSLGFGLSLLRQFGHRLGREPAQNALPSGARRD